MAKKAKVQGRAAKQKKAEGMMPASHTHMMPAEHKKAMAKMEGKAKPKRRK